MATVDLVVLGVMLLSGIIALTRGLVREVLSLAAWGGSIFAAMAFVPLAHPLVAPHMPEPDWTDPVSFILLFIVALIVFSLIARTIGNIVRASAIGGIDRTLGLLFGLARGAAVAVAVYIIACMAFPPAHWPPQVLEARSLPLIYSGAAWVVRMLPEEYRPKEVTPPPAPGGQASDQDSAKPSPVGQATDQPVRK